MDNIFQGAKLGDKYKLSNGKYAVYLCTDYTCDSPSYELYVPNRGICRFYFYNGVCKSLDTNLTIVGSYDPVHPLDIDSLKALADSESRYINVQKSIKEIFMDAFVRGYVVNKEYTF